MGFTSASRLTDALGAGQPWIRLAEPALRALIAPLGVTTVTIDPRISAPAPETLHHRAPEVALVPAEGTAR
ncbi:SAV_915 family protein [Streptomyces blattellae]|uniref:SAV_915 family protein n=1 Tax=Streptomyces blattellae TaxID=2569855 RepID=UPI0038B58702